MRKLLCVALVVALSGCAAFSNTATPQQVQTQYVQACAAYGAAFSTALQLRVAGKLSQAEIDTVSTIDSQITPICTGPLPSDPAQATVQITAAVTTLGILEAAKQVKP